MTKTLLEKMAWLYSQGFEPDMAYITHIQCTQSSWEDEGLIAWYGGNNKLKPYFSESRLWSLLPKGFDENGIVPELRENGNLTLLEVLLDLVIFSVKKATWFQR